METKDLMLSQYERPVDSVSVSTNLETAELIEAFLSGKSLKTIEVYKRDLEDFRKFLKVPDTDYAAKLFLLGGLYKANHIALKYKNHLSGNKKLQPTTVNRKLAALSSLTDMAYTLGMITLKRLISIQDAMTHPLG